MFDASEEKPGSRIRVFPKYLWFAVLGVALIVGLVFYSRWDQNHKFAQRAGEKKREQDQQDAELLGGNRFEILQFYATPMIVQRGENVHLCYGVSNAKKVTLEPQTEPVWPSLNHCVILKPEKDTTYKLTAEDATGKTKTQNVAVQVR